MIAAAIRALLEASTRNDLFGISCDLYTRFSSGYAAAKKLSPSKTSCDTAVSRLDTVAASAKDRANGKDLRAEATKRRTQPAACRRPRVQNGRHLSDKAFKLVADRDFRLLGDVSELEKVGLHCLPNHSSSS